MLLAILGYVVVGPVMSGILTVLAAGVNILVSHSPVSYTHLTLPTKPIV